MEYIIQNGVGYLVDVETGEMTPAIKKGEIAPNFNFLNDDTDKSKQEN